MKTYVTKWEFMDTFRQSSERKDTFSYEGLQALFEYFEEYEESCGEEIKFDMIAICCEYSEYENLKEYQEDNQSDIETLEELQDETTVIPIENTDKFIIQVF